MRLRSALLLLCFGFVGGVAAFFLLQKAGLLGSRFGDDQPLSLVEEAALAEGRIASRFPRARRDEHGATPAEEVSFRLQESDLRDLALVALASRAEGLRVLEFCRRIETEIDDGEIGVTLVLDLSRLPIDQLGPQEREVVDKIQAVLPVIGEGDLPVGFYGRPEASAGRFRLGGSPRLQISILKLSLGTAAERLGIPEQQIEDALEIEWPGWEIVRVTVVGKEVELVVRSA